MGAKLPRSGVEVVIQGFDGFNKAAQIVEQRIKGIAKTAGDAGKGASPFDKALDSIQQKLAGVSPAATQAFSTILQLTSALGPMGIALAAAAAAAVALGVAFIALGQRGAPLVGLANSFDSLTSSIGISAKTLLTDLRAAAAGTVADFDLIKQANLALAGATGQFGKEFGTNLPKLLEIARVQARATGQDVGFLFQSIVTGIKRASPLLIDNTGLTLKISEANQAYADELGKTVEQLTAEEKQIAVLNATLAAGQVAIDTLGNAQETNAEKMARSNAIITNTLDTLALAVQPAFGTVLDIVNRILGAFQSLAVGIAPIIQSISSIITDILGGAFNIFLDIVSPIVSAISSFLPYISILFQGIANVVSGAMDAIRSVIGGIVGFIQGVAQNLFGLDISNLGKSLFEGAAAAFGSFANGIIAVANALIFPAIIGIATFIADFLIGQSPPPKGPLSMIDKGGENMMSAWLQGITGVSLQPVADVALEVSTMLGSIGKQSLGAVSKRLAQLDRDLLPFQQRLDIVKSQFDAIAAPAQAALDAIDRQISAAQAALESGDMTALATIQTLDAQRAAIQGNLDAQQAIVDKQQIQLELAKANQSQERTLLSIRKAYLESLVKSGKATKEQVDKALTGPKPKGGESPIAEAVGGGISTPTGDNGSILDLLGGQDAVNAALTGLEDAFTGQIDTKGLTEFAANQALLGEQLGRFEGVDIGSKIGEKFQGLVDLFNPDVEGSPANAVKNFFTNLGPSIETYITDLGPNIQTAATTLGGQLAGMFDATVPGSPANLAVEAVRTLTGDDQTADSLASYFANLPANVATAASTLWTELDTNVFSPVRNFLTGEGEGTLSGILDGAVTFFTELPGRVVNALLGFGATVYAALVAPIIGAVNGLIATVEGAIKGFITSIADFLQPIADGLGTFAPQFLLDAISSLRTAANGIAFTRISTVNPFEAALGNAPGAARGGLFGPGLMQVGENGPEFMMNGANKAAVFPNSFVQAIEGLTQVLAQPAPMAMGGGTYNTSTFNFNGVQSDNDARRRFNSLRAGMR